MPRQLQTLLHILLITKNNKDPFETFYLEPQYDARDFKGRKVEVQKNVKNWLGKNGMMIELILMQKEKK